MEKTIVFGGWAIPPDILKSFFGDGADYVDVNPIMPKLFTSNQLRNDWAEIIAAEYQPLLTGENHLRTIAGWSTGAMFAYAAARIYPPEKLILLSATPCFCRKDDFRFGTRAAVLDQMIDALGNNRDAVLKSFYERCGLNYSPEMAVGYTINELSCGLLFLKQADLRPIAPLSAKALFYHGRDDLIIPISASKYFCGQTNGKHVEAPGGHAFFTDFSR